mmetsp:Transcript_13868/g.23642  ORF Transcript_13868/g.23642 Transcript_13868/m.23642 type:complete len:97 (+) Transcript_13868:476-766(+)
MNLTWRNARDIQLWQLVYNLPAIIWLTVFYLFMVDIENHYIDAGTTIDFLKISTFTAAGQDFITGAISQVNVWMLAGYNYLALNIFIYLSPFYWVQ